MSTNTEEIKQLQDRIIVKEMIQKFENATLVWEQAGVNYYKTMLDHNGAEWQVFITMISRTGFPLVVMDFKRDGQYMYSVNSDQDDSLFDLFDEIQGDERFTRDQEILNYVSQL